MKRLRSLIREIPELSTLWTVFIVFCMMFMLAGGAYAITPYTAPPSGYQISPRYNNTQNVEYYRFTINWNDPSISTSQYVGALPANAYILTIDAYVVTAFNATTTNVITVGTTAATHNELVASGITAGTPGIYHLTTATGLGVAVSGGATWTGKTMPLYLNYTQTGTAATAGQVIVTITYIPNNDQ